MRCQQFSMTLIASLFSPFLCGCLMTQTMWREAKTTQMEDPHIVGVIRSSQEGSPDKLIVRYDLESGFRSQLHPEKFVLIRFTFGDQACLIHPAGRSEAEILAQLKPTERQSLEHMQVTLISSPGHAKGYMPSDPAQPLGEPPRGTFASREALEVLPFRRRSDGGVEMIWFYERQALPTDAFAVILPRHLARPAKDIESAKSKAALLTPLTLIADVFVTPIVFISLLVG